MSDYTSQTTDRDPDAHGYGKLSAKSDAGLISEWHFWNNEIASATGWGAAVGAAHGFRKAAEREILLRGMEIPNV